MNNTQIAFIGLGNVVPPLEVDFAEKFQVVGFEINPLGVSPNNSVQIVLSKN